MIVVIRMLLISPGFLWLMWVGVLVSMFKFVGLGIMLVVQGLLILFMRYWNQKSGISKFVKVVVGTIMLITNIMLVGGGYLVILVLGPIISICFYLLLIKLVFKLAHKISLLIVSK